MMIKSLSIAAAAVLTGLSSVSYGHDPSTAPSGMQQAEPAYIPTVQELESNSGQGFIDWLDECRDEGHPCYLPAGIIDLPCDIELDDYSGLRVVGCGLSHWRIDNDVSPQTTPPAIEQWGLSSWHGATTVIRFASNSTATTGFKLVNCHNMVWEGVTFLRRDEGLPMLYWHTTSTGLRFDNCGFYGESSAVRCGGGNNAAETAYFGCWFEGFGKGAVLWTLGNQNVNHRFFGCDFHHKNVLIDQDGGGNVTLTGCSTNDVRTIIRAASGGSSGRPHLTAIGCKFDNSGGKNTILVDLHTNNYSPNGAFMATFIGGSVNCSDTIGEDLVLVHDAVLAQVDFYSFFMNSADGCTLDETVPSP